MKYLIELTTCLLYTSMPLGRLAGLEREKIQTEVDELHAKIAEYNAILADEHKVLALSLIHI